VHVYRVGWQTLCESRELTRRQGLLGKEGTKGTLLEVLDSLQVCVCVCVCVPVACNSRGREMRVSRIIDVCPTCQQKRYTGTVGVEYMHLRDASRSTWLRDRVEDYDDRAGYWSKEDKLQILDRVAYVCVSV
jgi:hypothetical protein